MELISCHAAYRGNHINVGALGNFDDICDPRIGNLRSRIGLMRMPSNKHEQFDFKKGDTLLSPSLGFVTILAVRGVGRDKEFQIEIGGEKVWHKSRLLRG